MQAQVWHCPCSLRALACLGNGCVAHVAWCLSSFSFLPVLICPCFLQLLPLALLTFILLVPDFFVFLFLLLLWPSSPPALLSLLLPMPPPSPPPPSAYSLHFPSPLAGPNPVWHCWCQNQTPCFNSLLFFFSSSWTVCFYCMPLHVPSSFFLRACSSFFCRTTMFEVFVLHKLIAMALSKWRAHEVLNDVLKYVTPWNHTSCLIDWVGEATGAVLGPKPLPAMQWLFKFVWRVAFQRRQLFLQFRFANYLAD